MCMSCRQCVHTGYQIIIADANGLTRAGRRAICRDDMGVSKISGPSIDPNTIAELLLEGHPQKGSLNLQKQPLAGSLWYPGPDGFQTSPAGQPTVRTEGSELWPWPTFPSHPVAFMDSLNVCAGYCSIWVSPQILGQPFYIGINSEGSQVSALRTGPMTQGGLE